MPTIVAGFAERSAAGAACQELVERYRGLSVALRLSADDARAGHGDGLLSELRSLMVEIVGVEHADGAETADGYAARLVVSDVPASQLDGAKAVLTKHQASFISEQADGADPGVG